MSPNQNLHNGPLTVAQWSINYSTHGHLAAGVTNAAALCSKIKAAIACGCETYNDAVTVTEIVYCKILRSSVINPNARWLQGHGYHWMLELPIALLL